MEQIYITSLEIKKVRHLKDIFIPLSEKRRKHLILTGKNGSGKTSVVEALAGYMTSVLENEDVLGNAIYRDQKEETVQRKENDTEIIRKRNTIYADKADFARKKYSIDIKFNKAFSSIAAIKGEYHYVSAYYSADRTFSAIQPQHIEKVHLKYNYGLTEYPRNEFIKYLLDLKMTEALARNNQKTEKADEIKEWFEVFQQLLRRIFSDETVTLEFDEDNYEFRILQQGKEPFDFNTLSSGYQAVLDIVVDIIMRMQNQKQRSFDFNLPGIVLIDEIETHLHLEMQKNIMPFLTTIFPNIQFIVTTHSPFILNSLEDVVIYDLENKILVENGLENVPYDGIVEGYFGAGKLSDTLKEKFEQYKSLTKKKQLSYDEMSRIAELELYLDEVPDYLAIGITTEYQRLKLEFMNREDIDG